MEIKTDNKAGFDSHSVADDQRHSDIEKNKEKSITHHYNISVHSEWGTVTETNDAETSNATKNKKKTRHCFSSCFGKLKK